MALILNIDASTEIASVVIARKGESLARIINTEQKDHASWLHEAIRKGLNEAGISMQELKAIAVTSGPGSYTGIRVGMASAKGLAYALGIPLITENTLKVMAWSMKALDADPKEAETKLYCPMIDARRDEVFAAVYGGSLAELVYPAAMHVSEEAFRDQLEAAPVVFFGSGSDKWKPVLNHSNALFQKWDYVFFNLAYLSYESYLKGAFADLAYVSPDYLKEVYTHKKN